MRRRPRGRTAAGAALSAAPAPPGGRLGGTSLAATAAEEDGDCGIMTVTGPERPAQARYSGNDFIRPVLVCVSVAGTAAQWPDSTILFPAVALPLFVLASLTAVVTLFPLSRLTVRQETAVVCASMVFAALLLPLAHQATIAQLFPFVAAGAAGGRLASRKAAVGVAAAGAVVAVGATWAVVMLRPDVQQWPWWVTLTVGLPVYIGVSHQERKNALHSARLAAQEARRARESEAREAALLERGRIAREIHDVLGHSLSGIALQLDLADALRQSGRDDEASVAVRRARSLAVDSIGETRRAVHALREDIVPLTKALSRLAEYNAVGFTIAGEDDAVGPEATHTLVRGAQEALTNAAKHAPGAARTMRLAFTAAHVTLTVRNGPPTGPLDPDLAGSTGVGLVGMRERAVLLGGTLQAGPAREGGWTVELELPR